MKADQIDYGRLGLTAGTGALSGAQAGASIGALAGGVGAVPGAAIGAAVGLVAGGIGELYSQSKAATLSDQQKDAQKKMKKLQKQQEMDAKRREKDAKADLFLADAGDAVMMMDPTTVYQPQTLGAFKPPKGRL